MMRARATRISIRSAASKGVLDLSVSSSDIHLFHSLVRGGATRDIGNSRYCECPSRHDVAAAVVQILRSPLSACSVLLVIDQVML